MTIWIVRVKLVSCCCIWLSEYRLFGNVTFFFFFWVVCFFFLQERKSYADTWFLFLLYLFKYVQVQYNKLSKNWNFLQFKMRKKKKIILDRIVDRFGESIINWNLKKLTRKVLKFCIIFLEKEKDFFFIVNYLLFIITLGVPPFVDAAEFSGTAFVCWLPVVFTRIVSSATFTWYKNRLFFSVENEILVQFIINRLRSFLYLESVK